MCHVCETRCYSAPRAAPVRVAATFTAASFLPPLGHVERWIRVEEAVRNDAEAERLGGHHRVLLEAWVVRERERVPDDDVVAVDALAGVVRREPVARLALV